MLVIAEWPCSTSKAEDRFIDELLPKKMVLKVRSFQIVIMSHWELRVSRNQKKNHNIIIIYPY